VGQATALIAKSSERIRHIRYWTTFISTKTWRNNYDIMSLNFTKRLATDIYSAVFSVVWSNSLATASTSCNVCQRLEPPWPILIYDFYVEGNGHLSCPGCELLYTVFEPIYKRTFQGNLHGKVDFREGKMYIRLCNTFSYVVYIGKGMSTIRVKPLPILIRISGE
jgi:hypothetical protein